MSRKQFQWTQMQNDHSNVCLELKKLYKIICKQVQIQENIEIPNYSKKTDKTFRVHLNKKTHTKHWSFSKVSSVIFSVNFQIEFCVLWFGVINCAYLLNLRPKLTITKTYNYRKNYYPNYTCLAKKTCKQPKIEKRIHSISLRKFSRPTKQSWD